MRQLFFYGTLLDPALLASVLGRVPDQGDIRPAILPGFEICAVRGRDFPFARRAEAGRLQGVVVSGLSGEDVARLAFYEGVDQGIAEQVQAEVAGRAETVEILLGDTGDLEAEGPWSVDRWTAEDRDVSLEAAKEIMTHFGTRPAKDVLKHCHMMRAQAQSRLTARKEASRGRLRRGLGRGDIEVEEVRRPYLDFFSVIERRLRFRKFNGDWSAPVDRTVFVGFDAVSVLPYDPKNDLVLLIEQFRAGPLARGDAYPWCVEAIAGRRDAGETPEETAMREAREEAGIDLLALEKVAQYYPSTAGFSEYLVSFVGLADLDAVREGFHGVQSEHEDIRAFTISFDQLVAALESGEIENAPLVLSVQWLQMNRERLRTQYGAA